ncbi:MAG: HAD-IC family P-type ATPase [Dehalococcoidia bacterium]
MQTEILPRVSHPWHAIPAEEAARELETGPHGLSAAIVDERLRRYGANRLEEAPSVRGLEILLHQFASPLIYILLAATIVTILIGEFVDAGFIAAVLILNAAIGFVQERRAEESVRALMRLISPQARVIREGREWQVSSADLVPGDVVFVESGTRVPADLRLFSTTALEVDESLLTGESVPVNKNVLPVTERSGLADRTSMAFTGAVVTSGRGRGYVVATGAGTEIGAIAEIVRQSERVETPLQRRMSRFGRAIAVAIGASATVAFALGVATGESTDHMFLVAVGLAVAAIPEALPVVFTITLALGVRRMARRNAIIRRLPAVETLGSTTVIGSDKTGTLTQNRMTVREIWTANRTHFVDNAGPLISGTPLYETLLAGVLTNEAEAYETAGEYATRGDPTEAALLIAAELLGIDTEDVREAYQQVTDIPFEPERQYSASFRSRDGQLMIAAKGAPERILGMCRTMLGDEGATRLDHDVVHQAAADMASRGLRVLAMAHSLTPKAPDLPEISEPRNMVFLGLQGMLDPPRPGVKEAIAACQGAGIRVLMLTGDHAGTAHAVAVDIGIAAHDAKVLLGTDLDAMTESELRDAVGDTSIYARVSPENKLQVVRALQARGEVVAVTGDGVNDAPALKSADIGVAMGKSGTDVAREAADMVLTDDNFVSLQAAVNEGRVTFDNLRKVTFFLISTGVAAVIVILSTLVLQWPLPFLPAQLLWLNLVTNGLQVLALAFEPGEKGILQRPPRPRSEGILSPVLWERTVLAGITMAIGTLLLFRWELNQTGSIEEARTVALTTMVLFQMIHVGNCRSQTLSAFQKSPLSNPFLFIATATALTVHVCALYFPPTQYVLRVEPLAPDAWIRMALVGLSVIVVVEVHKLLRRPSATGKHASSPGG